MGSGMNEWNWDELPGELKDRRPVAEQVYHKVAGYKTEREVVEELEFAISELQDWREEAESMANHIEEAQLEVHALQLRLIELRYRNRLDDRNGTESG